jgi:hypothetical protein
MNSKLIVSAAAVMSTAARSSWQTLSIPSDKNKFEMYWYTIDDATLGPIIRPTLRL